MITMKEWMELVDYKITEGDNYGWSCFGTYAYTLDYWNGDHNGYSMVLTFDTKTQVVYMVEAHDFKNQRAYRMIDPAFKETHDAEYKTRGIEDQAWEDDNGDPVKYTDLDVDADFLEKARAIVAGEDYDTRVQISVDFTNEELLQYAIMAHEQDITLNELIEGALRDMIDRHDLLKEWK